MLVLAFKTDDVLAEISLYDDHVLLHEQQWQAHRELAATIHTKIVDVLMSHDKRLHELQGIVVYKGPGSFTGLRIGISVANALAYSLKIPICSGTGEMWATSAISSVLEGDNERTVKPEYGAAPHITQPKH